MIPKYLAMKFLESLTEKLGYNINIIDEKGIIIASSDKSREGTFHEAAYKLIKEKLEVMKIYSEDPLLLGVKPGVNLPVRYEKEVIGVVGVTGNPNEVQAVAYAIKTSLETMIEYEFYKDNIFLRQSVKNMFVNLLLYEKDYDVKMTESMATRLGYSTNAYRVPIIVAIKGKMSSEDYLSFVKKNKFHSNQDISCVSLDRNILIFKVVKIKSQHIFEDIRAQIVEYIGELSKILKSIETSCSLHFYVGNFECNFVQYRYHYEQVRWCKDFVQCNDNDIVFFIDHVEEYLFSRIPQIDLFNVFSTTYSIVKKIDKEKSLLNTVRTIYDSGMNFQKAATTLGIHRNTVYQRLKHLNEVLGFDAIADCNRNRYIYYLIKSWNSASK